MEGSLRQMMDEDKDHTRGAEIVAQMEETLNLVFDEISFEMGFNGEKYELILTPEGTRSNCLSWSTSRSTPPKRCWSTGTFWWAVNPSKTSVCVSDDGWDISGEDVQIWLEEQGENSFAISAYCEKLLPMLREAEGRVWWMLTTLTDQVLGEISHMWYIDSFDVLEEPKAEPLFPLSQLPDMLKEKGANLTTDPEVYLDSYLGYEMKPNEDPDADWRLDVMVGSTCCVPLINGYLNADNDFMDDLHADGAVAGFFCYPLDTLREEEGSRRSLTSGTSWRKCLPPATDWRFLTSPAEPPAFSAAMWTSSPGTYGRRSRWQRSSSSAATSPGPASTPSVGKQAL